MTTPTSYRFFYPLLLTVLIIALIISFIFPTNNYNSIDSKVEPTSEARFTPTPYEPNSNLNTSLDSENLLRIKDHLTELMEYKLKKGLPFKDVVITYTHLIKINPETIPDIQLLSLNTAHTNDAELIETIKKTFIEMNLTYNFTHQNHHWMGPLLFKVIDTKTLHRYLLTTELINHFENQRYDLILELLANNHIQDELLLQTLNHKHHLKNFINHLKLNY